MAGAQVGFSFMQHHPPRAPPAGAGGAGAGGAGTSNALNAKQVLPALGSAVEAAEAKLGSGGEAKNGTFDFTPGHQKVGKTTANKTFGDAVPVELYVDGLPSKASRGPACKDNPGCENLNGNCCPTWDGLNLGCCFTWQSPVPSTPPAYVKVPDTTAAEIAKQIL
ncbi:GBA [Symbiodinium natans]|uniref:GBA protein n=1 Tax=Symbiodinium natans TaxID=878477 RepID=A0A812PKI4_9DINO|nr:GBA [Symbiodinium natans]